MFPNFFTVPHTKAKFRGHFLCVGKHVKASNDKLPGGHLSRFTTLQLGPYLKHVRQICQLEIIFVEEAPLRLYGCPTKMSGQKAIKIK
jgi:hypothetical protein